MSIMPTVLVILLYIIMIVRSFRSLSELPPSPPPFSWDRIPLFIGPTQNESGPLNETAAKYISKFPLAAIGANQDVKRSNLTYCEEDRIIAALQKIRSYNTSVRTIFYLNTILNHPQYALAQNFTGSNEKYLLHDQNGKLVYFTQCNKHHPNTTIFDVSQNQTRTFWLNTVKYALTKYPGVVDGLFADRGRANVSVDLECVNLTETKANAWNSGHTLMMQQAMQLVKSINNERGIVIPNNADIESVNGRMFENFRVNDSRAVPAGDDLFVLMNENDIRISEVHSDKCSFYSEAYNKSLAAYLIGACKYSYYACTNTTNGWSIQHGWDILWQNPDFNKPLGEPLMNATYNNNTKIYYREFEKGVKVWLDQQWKYPCIKWSDHSITGGTQNCNKYSNV